MVVTTVGDFVRIGRFSSKKSLVQQVFIRKDKPWDTDAPDKYYLMVVVKGAPNTYICEQFDTLATAQFAMELALEELT